MATYEQLQHLVKECVDLGLVQMGKTSAELREVFKERTKDVFAYDARDGGDYYHWGRTSRANEGFVDFANECAKVIYGLPAWPADADVKSITGEDVEEAKRLGVAVEDLPHVAEAIEAGEFESYLAVCALPKKKHLSLRFYLDMVAAGVHEMYPDCKGDSKAWGRFYGIALKRKASVAQLCEAMRRQCELYPNCDLDLMMSTLDIPESELRRWTSMGQNKTTYDLYKAGVISYDFAIKYGHRLTYDWRRCKKITGNPAWNKLDPSIALGLYRGKTPQQIAADQKCVQSPMELTQKEAAAWLGGLLSSGLPACYGYVDPTRFLATKLGISYNATFQFRDVTRTLLLWYARKKDLASMNKTRVMYGPGGQHREFCYNDMLDEITEADLGPADASLAEKLNANPEKVFAAAAKRLNDLYLAQLGSDIKLPKFEQEKVRIEGVRQLRSSTELITEGKDMGHCVGGYIGACVKKISYIFSVSTDAGRSTFEVCNNNGFYVAQHRGRNNNPAPAVNKVLVAGWCEANGIHNHHSAAFRCAA